jgi:hypothetical protein
MGGAVSAIGNLVSAPATIAGAIPGIGKIAGPIVGGITGGPVGFATSLAGQAIQGNYGGGGGGGGSSAPSGSTAGSTGTTPYYSPTYNYGANSYTVDNNPYDTSKYFIQGNKGSYNVLPQLANLYDPATQQRAGAPSANIYNDIIGQFSQNQDTLAQQNFQKNFGLQTYNPTAGSPTTLASGFTGPDYLKSDIQNALGEYYPSGSTQTDSIPVNYADFGFKSGDTLQKIANYAKTQNNPFFMPYAPEDVRQDTLQPQPIMPVSSNPQVAQPLRYAPSQDARGPAPRDIAPASMQAYVQGKDVAPPPQISDAVSRDVKMRLEPNGPTAQAQQQQSGVFKPVNIRTGGLASLRRK